MTPPREQDRRHRRGEPSGGAPSRRSDRVRRPAGKSARERSDADAEFEESPGRRLVSGRINRRAARRAFGQVLGRLTTRRAALLALVVCALALSIAVPLHTYLSQRDDLREQMVQQQALISQEQQLEKREQQLSDPAQVEAEARTRLHYVMPGETPYVVQLPAALPPPGQQGAGARKAPDGSAWYQALWNTIVGAH